MSEAHGAGGVYRKVQQVSEQVGDIPKTGYNEHFGYEYHEADRVMAELRPLLADAGLVIVPNQIGIEDVSVETKAGYAMLTTVKHELRVVDTEDGSSFTVTVFGRGQDSADKGPTKAYTMAYKYGVMKLFGVASNQSDPDASAPARRTGNNEGPAFTCPECDSGVWDNRTDPDKEDWPDLKCRSDDCEWKAWDAEPTADETLEAIGTALNELSGWNRNRSAEVSEWLSDHKPLLKACQAAADGALDRVESAVEEAKDQAEASAQSEQGAML